MSRLSKALESLPNNLVAFSITTAFLLAVVTYVIVYSLSVPTIYGLKFIFALTLTFSIAALFRAPKTDAVNISVASMILATGLIALLIFAAILFIF